MQPLRWYGVWCMAVTMSIGAMAAAQVGQRSAEIGSIFPAGGCRGTTFQVVVGGQYLKGATEALITGVGVNATVVDYTAPLPQKKINEVRTQLAEARKRYQEENKNTNRPGAWVRARARIREMVLEMGVDEADLVAFEEFQKRRNDPKRQLNPQLSESVTLQVTIDPATEPGPHALRLLTASGLSNPLPFQVGCHPEVVETEPNDRLADLGIERPLPCVINGQILPGDVDRFRFQARRGDRLVAVVEARALIPYLADAVPGWFQATLALTNATGQEVAYADDYRFDPDPVLQYEIPEDGVYVLEIKDAIYRGREDFVYRVTLGELPLVTSAFPLGGSAGRPTPIDLEGWNLPTDRFVWDGDIAGAGSLTVAQIDGVPLCRPFPLAIDALPGAVEVEPNDMREQAERVTLPRIVDGRIDRPGDWDIFCLPCQRGDSIHAEIQARRLGSPLDSILKWTDAKGQLIGASDDHDDPSVGLMTHHADSCLQVTIPNDGLYYLHVGDIQNQGSSAHGYRLYLNAQRPDFELRVVPSTINARVGETVPVTVHALRQGGFQGAIELGLRADGLEETAKSPSVDGSSPGAEGDPGEDRIQPSRRDPIPGFQMGGGTIPAGQDRVRITITAPPRPLDRPCRLVLVGRATIQGEMCVRQAVPADDWMQAFVYHHLVPTDDLVVAVLPGWRFRARVRILDQQPVTLTAGGTAAVRISVAGRPLPETIQLELNDPPPGVSIQNIRRIPAGVAIHLQADASQARPGQRGNLIVDAYTERTAQNRTRRIPLGSFPAIPFAME